MGNKAFDEFYEASLTLLHDLIEMDPDPDTPEGKLLAGLSAAHETYEKAVLEGTDNATV